MREAGLMLAIGMICGIGAATALGKLMESFLFGMHSWDLPVYGGATVILGLIALAAAYVPARRATSIEPMSALRYE